MMTFTEPKIDKDGRYSTMETCKVLGIHRNTLMNYTKAGHIRCGYRRENARKFYLGSEILRFWRAQF